MTEIEYLEVIRDFVREGLSDLDPHDDEWASRRLVDPRPIQVVFPGGSEGESTETVYLVTDYVDGDTEDYRVVYDPALITFGLIQHDRQGREVLLGLYGDFAQTVRSL
jgi:hypothetical protein